MPGYQVVWSVESATVPQAPPRLRRRAGASRFLSAHAPTIVMEGVGHTARGRRTAHAIELPTRPGYKSYAIRSTGNLVPSEIALGHIGELNNFCFRKD